MWAGIVWFALLMAAGLCHPRRPRTAAALFIMLGFPVVFSGGSPLVFLSSAFWIGLGVSYLVKYRKPDARAKHLEYWTAKA